MNHQAHAEKTTWMGKVPSHWNVKALKYCADLVTDRVNGSAVDSLYVGLEHIESATGRLIREEGSQENAESTVNCFCSDDVLFGKLRPYLAKAAVAESNGVCSSEILVYRPHGMTPHYLKHVMLLDGFIEEVSASTYGSKMPRADAAFISRLPVPVPPLDEQISIAAYLDSETKRIDGLIEGKVELQLLLNELKRNTNTKGIHEGLDPDFKKKVSGTSWFSELPVHWRPMRLKRIIEGIENGWSPQCEGEPAEAGQWGVLKAGACNGGVFRVNENKALPTNETPRPELEIKLGNVLMSRASGSLDLVGSVAFVEDIQPGIMLSDKIFRLNIDEELVCGEWLSLALNSTPMRRQIASFVGGAEGLARNIASSAIRELVLPVPPREEQVEIVKSVKRDMVRIEELVLQVDEEIALLREFRSATITDAVLGRLQAPTSSLKVNT